MLIRPQEVSAKTAELKDVVFSSNGRLARKQVKSCLPKGGRRASCIAAVVQEELEMKPIGVEHFFYEKVRLTMPRGL